MRVKNLIVYKVMWILIYLTGCDDATHQEVGDGLFVLLPSSQTGIDFENTLSFDEKFNIYTYRNFYNGGGVAIGDINNDGLADIYLTSNQESNRLYLNKGDFKFEDITEKSGTSGTHSWSTGVAMADINGDGLLDIYVCNSGDVEGDDRKNELFINNGDLTFAEKAEQLGLADDGLSIHSTFFDYDNDGDLDVYVLNNSFRAIGSFDMKNNQRNESDELGGDKLYRNKNGVFEDYTKEAGLYSSVIGFGLGVMVSDLDNDGWLDMYVCNDFFERDYVYMNNHDGTFREELTNQMRSISMASMGVDIADVNNDGLTDIFVTEMLPGMESRIKTSMTFEDWNKYQYNLQHGYYHQFTRNMLHINNGRIEKDDISFSEKGRLAGVEATDWSWGVVMTDLNLDGNKDIYITNGIYQDILNQDYLRYVSNPEVARTMITGKGVDYKKLIEIIPSQPLSNIAYAGNSDLSFTNQTNNWGLQKPGFSNGVAYGDLDNDGDPDLVVNNVNMEAFVYRNQTTELHPQKSFLKLKLNGSGANVFAIGAKVTVMQKGDRQTMENIPSRGFQSSVDYALNFGLKTPEPVDTLLVVWPGGKRSILVNVLPNQTLEIDQSGANTIPVKGFSAKSFDPQLFRFKNVSGIVPDDFAHEENVFSDFEKDALIIQMNSTEGPKMTVGDVDNNGLDDIYLCGALGSPGKLLLQTSSGEFSMAKITAFERDQRCEDVDALFFDADADHDLDLYVVSGGNEYPSSSSALVDRLYLNDGNGMFSKSGQSLPTTRFESTSCVDAADFDHDGDLDLFVGVRLKDRRYGEPQNGYILENNGKGEFENVTDEIAPGLSTLGLIKDAIWSDVNNDQQMDLMVIGEWMPVQVFVNDGGKFINMTKEAGLSEHSGWWNTIESADLDNDGDADFIVGNHGLNSRIRASNQKPVTCYINDFDVNGSLEQIICAYNGDQSYPLVLYHDLIRQLPYLKSKYRSYQDFQLQQVSDIFSEEQINSSIKYVSNFLESAVLINKGDETFSVRPLPKEAQISPVYAIHVGDFNRDDIPDLLVGGNLYEVKPEIGPYDSSHSTCLIGNGDGTFKPIENKDIGLKLTGQVRDIKPVLMGEQTYLFVSPNDGKVQVLKMEELKTKNEEVL